MRVSVHVQVGDAWGFCTSQSESKYIGGVTEFVCNYYQAGFHMAYSVLILSYQGRLFAASAMKQWISVFFPGGVLPFLFRCLFAHLSSRSMFVESKDM